MFSLAALLVLPLMGLMDDDPALNLDSLANIMEGLQAGLEDVEFVYEGAVIQLEQGETRDSPGETFQGNFAYRSDGSAHIDVYIRKSDQRIPLDRRILCLSNRSHLEEMNFKPDRAGSVKPRRSHGGLLSLNQPTMPLRIFVITEVMEFLRDSGGYRTNNNFQYECLGWENINNFKCLRVRFFSGATTSGLPGIEYCYWLDMHRGGTPIKREFKNKGKLWTRTEDIELAAFELPSGQTYWLPIRGVFRSFLKPRFITTDTPVVEETCNVVNETVIFNQKLRDDRFRVDWKTPPRTPGLQVARAEFEKKASLSPHPKPQARIEEALDVAARQERLLEASAPSRESWLWANLAAITALAFGIAILGGAYIIWIKNR